MSRPLLLFLSLLALGLGAAAEFADYFYLPPSAKSSAGDTAERYPLPRDMALRLLGQERPVRTLNTFAGKNAELCAKPAGVGAFRVAEGEAVAWDAAALFGPALTEGNRNWFTAEAGSAGALALRLRVDVSGFGPDDALYCMDIDAGRTHGPYTVRDASEAGLWLPTTVGDRVVLALSSPGAVPPPLHVEAVSHFFAFYSEKAADGEPCPIPADCETGSAAFHVSTSAGLIIVPQGLGQVQCTGTLLNRAGAPTLDPLFITARHCFDSGSVRARDVDVFWDYRTGGCDPALPRPALADLPRSAGRELLAHSARLDGQFLRLDGAPVGAFGRAWAGWDTAEPGLGAAVQGFHCPAGTPLKTCRGVVLEVNREECLTVLCTTKYERQTRVRWNEGITEGGSSGSGLFMADGAFRLTGMLSNGTVHICGRPAFNLDNYASFRDFFPVIACHLVDGAPCAPGDSASRCFLGRMLGRSGAAESLRYFRDTVLMPLPVGKKVVAAYYAASPAIERAAEASPAFRALSAVCAAGALLLPPPPGGE